jgi:hypothetical protein
MPKMNEKNSRVGNQGFSDYSNLFKDGENFWEKSP